MKMIKLKYFLRGLGMGVFVTAVIFSISQKTNQKSDPLTDEEIISRAEVLGMVLPESPAPSEEESPQPSQTPPVTQPPEPSPAETPSESPAPAEDTKTERKEYIRISVKEGMWSEEVADVLKTAGLIEDTQEFNEYLTNNGYASLLYAGTYDIEKGATYEEIARKITGQKEQE